ncbi:hypothetical protein M9H77_27831 [Catharanthus roseus]|uniref:Uncharacterized protein n=1 Tax=Catharanthus roseus TaxID=4058 RepID=A0ACC0ADN4_CATRO|nr:hypothetical protein M9H77_27831 [Catharanthus roseus]
MLAIRLQLKIENQKQNMALRLRVLRYSGLDKECSSVIRRWVHAIAQPAPLLSSMNHCSSTSPVLVLPEPEKPDDISSFSFNHGFMELMAVPKKKTSESLMFSLFNSEVSVDRGLWSGQVTTFLLLWRKAKA